MSSSVTNPDLNCYILQNGTLQPIAQALSVGTSSESTSPRAQTPIAKSSSQSNESEVPRNHVEPSKPIKRKDSQNRYNLSLNIDNEHNLPTTYSHFWFRNFNQTKITFLCIQGR